MPDDYEGFTPKDHVEIIRMDDFFLAFELLLRLNRQDGEPCWMITDGLTWTIVISQDNWPLYRDDILKILKEEGYDR